MRTSGGRGSETWIIVIPVVALIAAASMGNGSVDGLLMSLESAVRSTLTGIVEFVSHLF